MFCFMDFSIALVQIQVSGHDAADQPIENSRNDDIQDDASQNRRLRCCTGVGGVVGNEVRQQGIFGSQIKAGKNADANGFNDVGHNGTTDFVVFGKQLTKGNSKVAHEGKAAEPENQVEAHFYQESLGVRAQIGFDAGAVHGEYQLEGVHNLVDGVFQFVELTEYDNNAENRNCHTDDEPEDRVDELRKDEGAGAGRKGHHQIAFIRKEVLVEAVNHEEQRENHTGNDRDDKDDTQYRGNALQNVFKGNGYGIGNGLSGGKPGSQPCKE